MPENSHGKSFRTTNNSLATKNDSEYDESTDHRECLMEMEECNKMISFYKKKVQQLENENNALEVEIFSFSPENTAEKMELQDEIKKLIRDKQYLATQLNTITKNNKDLSRGYFPYTDVTRKIYNYFHSRNLSFTKLV